MDGLAIQGLLAACCLGVVLLLIVGAARLARRLPLERRSGDVAKPMTLLASMALDRTYRLHLVELSGERTLVLTGGAGALLAIGRSQ